MKMLGGADGINSDIISLNNGNSSSVINVKYEHWNWTILIQSSNKGISSQNLKDSSVV